MQCEKPKKLDGKTPSSQTRSRSINQLAEFFSLFLSPLLVQIEI